MASSKASNWEQYAQSFYPDVRWAFVLLYELIFAGLVYLFMMLLFGQMLRVLQNLSEVNLDQTAMLFNAGVITDNLDTIYATFGKVAGYLLLCILSCAFAYAFFNMLVWSKIHNRKLDEDYISRWVKGDFFWMLLWSALAVLVIVSFEPQYLVYALFLPLVPVALPFGALPVLFLLFLHFTVHFHLALCHTDKPWRNGIWNALQPARYWRPYGYILLTYVPIYVLFTLVPEFVVAKLAVLLVFSVWARFYLHG